MAGVRSPYIEPRPEPFPLIVMCRTCLKLVPKVVALSWNESLHSFFRVGIVVMNLCFAISCSFWRENTLLQGPETEYDKEGKFKYFTTCMIAVLILDQKVSDGTVQGRIPSARCEDLHIFKLLRLGISYGKHFFPGP